MRNPGRRSARSVALAVGAVVLAGSVLSACSSSSSSSGAVLLVGSFGGKTGGYRSIQSAVNAAKPGDWILVGPGDYHETADAGYPQGDPAQGEMGGVYITTSNLHLRGMDRSTVIVDGTTPGSAPCSSDPSAQTYGSDGANGKPVGRNGILVWKANDVSVENLTVCNFLAGTGDSGNQVWWNGGADSGKIGMTGYIGDYLTGTSTYFGGEASAAKYGIFSSNASGPASWNQLYGSNMNDSGMYVGACQQSCDVTIDHAWMQYNALGYSGTNSGGALVIENSQFDDNALGLDTNTQVAGDAPGPQNGACPDGATSPITHTHSCWVFAHNSVHDNNNPDTPIGSGGTGLAPVGTGMTISGGRNDTVMDNTFAGNGAWGTLFVPFPDSNTPTNGQTCSGVDGQVLPGALAALGCVIEPMGDALVGNHYTDNASFGFPGNADFGLLTAVAGQPSNCFKDNTAPKGSNPANLEQLYPTCGVTTTAAVEGLFSPVACAAGLLPCPAGVSYPKPTGVVMHPLPAGLPTMSDPCRDVPSNPWCPSGSSLRAPGQGPAGTALAVGGLGMVAVPPGRRGRPRH